MIALVSRWHRAVYLYLPALLFLPVVFYSMRVGIAGIGIAAMVWFFGGIMAGYLAYDAMHYILHHRMFRGRALKFLKAYHFKHHHVRSDRGFGVTSPLWDRVFGTWFDD